VRDETTDEKGNPMRTIAAMTIVAVAALSLATTAQDQVPDLELLQTFDDVRFFGADVTTLRTRIVSVTASETREAQLRLLFGDFGGEDATRIEFLSPEDLAGQIYLATSEATFFFSPDLDEPLRIGGNTTLFGDSAVAQTAGIRFATDYTVSERRTVTAEDGSEILEVDLAAVDFQMATVRADPDTLEPQSVILYAVSGLPFYEVFYETYAARGEEDVYVSVQRIENRILVDRTTTSEILEIGTDTLDPALFDPAQLGR
jgi:hypothetical protein